MKIGLWIFGPCWRRRRDGARRARARRSAGLESLWTGEHVVLPDPQAPPSPAAPRIAIPRSVGRARARRRATTRILLGTGSSSCRSAIPWSSRRSSRSVDVVSNGRLIFGLGAGYLEPEFRALGANYEERGAVDRRGDRRAARALDPGEARVLRLLYRFAGIDAASAARAVPHPPIVIGGAWASTAARLRRARRWLVRLLHQPRAHRASLATAPSRRSPRASAARAASPTSRAQRGRRRRRSRPMSVERYAELGVTGSVALAPPRRAGQLGRRRRPCCASSTSWPSSPGARRVGDVAAPDAPRVDARAAPSRSRAGIASTTSSIVGHGGAARARRSSRARGRTDAHARARRMGRGGGTTARSTGVLYFGGGARIQKACGF